MFPFEAGPVGLLHPLPEILLLESDPLPEMGGDVQENSLTFRPHLRKIQGDDATLGNFIDDRFTHSIPSSYLASSLIMSLSHGGSKTMSTFTVLTPSTV